MKLFCWTSLIAISFFAAPALSHPVPRDSHDRVIVVRLQKAKEPNRIAVRIEYRLEADETTIILNDMKPFADEANPLSFRGDILKYYAIFTSKYAEVFADRLLVRVNGKEITPLRCISRSERLRDEKGEALGHLRCDFVFESAFDAVPGDAVKIDFQDQTYHSNGIAPEPGLLTLSAVNETGLEITYKSEAEEALRKKPLQELGPDEEDRVRRLSVTLAVPAPKAPPPKQSETVPPAPVENVPAKQASHDERFSMLSLLLHNDYGFFLTMVLAFVFGAAHALTPGHGKTLVAAYLVGERGTIWHALYLGCVTTLTHTGAVMLIAIVLVSLPAPMQQTFRMWIQNGLGLLMGLIVACMGFWLLLQRLAGRPDHVHLDGGHNHHHPGDSGKPGIMSWWGLTLLGITGGMIPCWDAVGVLLITTGTNEMWLVLPAVLVFSAGLAVVLVAIGIMVVQVPRFVESRMGDGRILRSLPIASAVIVIAMGIWLCYEGVHGQH